MAGVGTAEKFGLVRIVFPTMNQNRTETEAKN